MAKILKFRENGIIVIGRDDGYVTEARRKDFNFEPQIGEEVEIYRNGNETFISKKYIKQNAEKNSEQNSKSNDSKIAFDTNNSNSNNSSSYNNHYNNSNDKFEYSDGIDEKAVGKLEYCLFACLLGGLGIHKFYAGKTGMGILYILFSWTGIPSIIGLIEGILAICKTADINGNILV